MNKGCLIGGIVGAVVIGGVTIVAVVIGIFYFAGKSQSAKTTPTPRVTETPASGVQGSDDDAPAPAARGDVPNAVVAKQMVNNTMVNFKNAINSGSFEAFYRTQLSDVWKKQTTPDALKNAFKVFIDRKIDLSPIFMPSAQSAMVIDPTPYLDNEGLLVVKGYYPLPAEKVRVTYELSYSREAKWGLSHINVKINPL